MNWKRLISGALAAGLLMATPAQLMASAAAIDESNSITYSAGGGTPLKS